MVALNEIAEAVLERTREGKLIWGELSTGGYYTKIAANTVTIDETNITPFTRGIRLRLTNDKGSVVESITSQDYTGLNELYVLARRQALRVDETLSNIKRALDSL